MFTRVKIENDTPVYVNVINKSFAAIREASLFSHLFKPYYLDANNTSRSKNISYIPVTYSDPTSISVAIENLNTNVTPYYVIYLITENGTAFIDSSVVFNGATTNLLGETLKIGQAFVASANTFQLDFTLTGATDIKYIVICAFSYDNTNEITNIKAEVV